MILKQKKKIPIDQEYFSKATLKEYRSVNYGLAFRKLGWVVRTIFLLEYCNNKSMRKEIGAATTKIESLHAVCGWISFDGQHCPVG
ncbi:hypothetical protein FCL47_24020 [Desulfopila sp. IMCC35006]|uniref:Tn3 family transposase n=1 Tax=Desulfopila sp. IMCC35006 TaxID=2569542 RepID=UPI0010AD196B|nr:hypothetical protein FCL47_24020 [Desulfopila sp. IMCC35006]